MKKNPIFFYYFATIATLLISIFCFFIIVKTLNSYISKTGKDMVYFYKSIQNVKEKNNFKDYKELNVLLLGLDKYNARPSENINSDTILLANIDFVSHKISLISLPRDLWSIDQKTKINTLYDLSIKSNKDLNFVKEEFSKVYGQKIDKIMVLDIDNIVSLVKIIGPLEITMENDYKDDQYPNPEYELNPKSGAPILTTIEFKKGLNIINETNILPFIRSRKGIDSDGKESNDLGRMNRQQQVINSIMEKTKKSEFWTNPQRYIEIYNLWQKDIKTDLNDSDIISLFNIALPNISLYTIKKINIPISEEIKEDTIIYHPLKTNFTKQWIYLPVGTNGYESLHQFISKSLTE